MTKKHNKKASKTPPVPKIIERKDIEYKASWLELFFDLVFVALVAQLTYYFSYHHSSAQDFLNTFIMWYMIFLAWWGTTANRNLKQRDDTFDIFVIQIQMLLAMIMSIGLPIAFSDSPYSFVFFLMFGLIRWLWLGMILHYYKLHPNKAPKTKNMISGFAVATLFWVAAGFFSSPYMYSFVFIAFALDILTPLTKWKGNKMIYLNMHHLVERLWLLVLMVMWESVLVVALANTAAWSFNLRNIIFVSAWIIQMIAVWWLYFPYIKHKLKWKRAKSFQVMLQSHIILLWSLVLLASWLKILLKQYESSFTEDFIFISGLFFIVASFNAIRASLTHKIKTSIMHICIFWLWIVLLVSWIQLFQLSNIFLVVLGTLWLILYTYYDYHECFWNKCDM